MLEATFEQHRYPTIDIIDDLVEQLNLPTQKITVRFNKKEKRKQFSNICFILYIDLVSKSSSTFKKISTKT